MKEYQEKIIEEIIACLDEIGISYPKNADIQTTIRNIVVDNFSKLNKNRKD